MSVAYRLLKLHRVNWLHLHTRNHQRSILVFGLLDYGPNYGRPKWIETFRPRLLAASLQFSTPTHRPYEALLLLRNILADAQDLTDQWHPICVVSLMENLIIQKKNCSCTTPEMQPLYEITNANVTKGLTQITTAKVNLLYKTTQLGYTCRQQRARSASWLAWLKGQCQAKYHG